MTPVSQYQSEKTAVEVAAESSDKSECSERHKLITVCRVVAFSLLMLYVVFGPFYKQVLKGKSRAFRSWQMYHTRGLGVCDVEFYIRHPDGRIDHIDHFKVLGYDKLLKLHHHSRRIMGEKGVLEVGQRLRQKVGNVVDLRVNARIGTREGWKTLYMDKRIE
ncbi:hypothetical protein J4G02_13385 [Candidatus Poribacteria bacterium]|nr:hypothetical protein [Candidatus Poribacteria bacterium]